MPAPHMMEHAPVQPTPPDRSGRDTAWFRIRMAFQLELAQRMMHAQELDDATMLKWTRAHAARFAEIVDANDAGGEEIRRLMREDREAALKRVQQQMLH